MDLATQTEQALIGSILHAPDKLVHIIDTVRPEDFTDLAAQKAYVAAVGLWRAKKQVDLVTVASVDISLASYLAEASSKGAAIAIKDYAGQIALSSKERRVSQALHGLINSKSPVKAKLDEILSLYQREMFVDRKNPDMASVVNRFNKKVQENRKRKSMGVPTGFGFLEELYIQYVPGHIWTMGGFTSAGKTATMVQKICNLIAMDKTPSVVVISTEMTEEQVISRILANFTGIHSQRILAGNFRQGEEEYVEEYKKLLMDKPVYIYDDVYTLGEIETVFRKADLQGGVDVGFIDYVQNCKVPDAKTEYQEQSTLAKRFQKLAKDVRTTLICLSQVSNDVGRGNTDNLELKGAGEWAAVSDLGIMLRRNANDEYALLYSVKKNRHGAKHDHHLEYKADYTRLEPIGPA